MNPFSNDNHHDDDTPWWRDREVIAGGAALAGAGVVAVSLLGLIGWWLLS